MKPYLLTVVLSLVLGTHSGFDCDSPRSSFGPLPPVVPGSFRMVYEKNDFIKNQTQFIDVWFDWKNQQARVDEVADNKGRVLLYDFNYGSSYVYDVPRPYTGEMTDERDFTCRYQAIRDLDVDDIYFYEPSEKPLRMQDAYHALLFGGPFRYAYVANVSDDSSRFIVSNKFQSCVKDDRSGEYLNIVYYWTLEDGIEKPVKCERKGGNTDEILSIIRFDRDPEFPPESFSVPRHMDCSGHPGMVPVNDFPSMSNDFAWREETITYSTTDEGKLYGNISESYKEIWVADQFKLARIDWTPTKFEVEKTFLENQAGNSLSIVADMLYKAVFITNNNSGRCSVVPLTEEFPLSKKIEDGSFKLKTALELIGMDGPRIIKGQYLERNSRVLVYSSNYSIDFNGDFNTAHETTLRFDEQQAVESYGAFEFVPVSQLTRTIATDVENEMPAKLSFKQTSYFRYRSEHHPLHIFAAPGCIVHHQRKTFELRFAGSSWAEISKRKHVFVDELRHQIYLRGDLGTVLRVHEVEVYFDSDVVATMTLLEPLKEVDSVDTISVDEAARRIAEVVDAGHMAVPFEMKDGDQILALELTFKQISRDRNVAKLRRSVRAAVPKSFAETASGYTTGSFIGICIGAFVIGIVGGFLLIYLRKSSINAIVSDEVPLGDIERNDNNENLDEPGPSGWKNKRVEPSDD